MHGYGSVICDNVHTRFAGNGEALRFALGESPATNSLSLSFARAFTAVAQLFTNLLLRLPLHLKLRALYLTLRLTHRPFNFPLCLGLSFPGDAGGIDIGKRFAPHFFRRATSLLAQLPQVLIVEGLCLILVLILILILLRQ